MLTARGSDFFTLGESGLMDCQGKYLINNPFLATSLAGGVGRGYTIRVEGMQFSKVIASNPKFVIFPSLIPKFNVDL